jgi:hypothetical protein
MPYGRLLTRGLLGHLNGFGLGHRHGRVGFAAHCSAGSALHSLPDDFGHWLIYRAGVGFLLGDTELGQHVDNGVRGDLKLPCELIDSNFTHK